MQRGRYHYETAIVSLMNKIFFLLIFTAAYSMVNGQTGTGSVVVNKDPRLDLLVSKQIEINEVTTRYSRRYSPGFRLLVISSNDRNKVMEVKTKMYRQFPELNAYLMYQAPFFRLKVGNFKERLDAEAYLGQVQKLVESNVYVVPDTIETRPDLGDD